MSNSDANIELKARTSEFEAKLARAVKSFAELQFKGESVSKSIDKSFKTITLTSKNSAREIEKSFNALNIKSDFSLSVQAKELEINARFFKQQYLKIRNDGTSSARDVTNAYQAMQIKLRQLSREKVSLTPFEQDQSAALITNKKFNEKRIANDKAASQAKIRIEKANLLAYEASENAAFRINLKLNEARAVSNKQLAQKKISDLNTVLQFERQVAADALAANRTAVMKRLRLLQETNSIEKSMAAQRSAGIAAGEQLRAKAASSAAQIKKASKATKELNGNVKDSARSMNLFNLASIASIAKIQVMFTLVNNMMGAIASLPGIAFDAVESFNAASISGAAIITSMQKSSRDLGLRYQENLEYSRAVNKELIRMDAHTAASFRNLSDMNTQFRNQGILIDVNNKKQVEGFTQTANALAVLTAGSPNQALQFTQEIKALLKGESRPGNLLFDLLNTTDNGNLKETLKTWQKISKETGNAGYALEQLGPMLIGFKAAQGDIDALWTTIKSTMVTIRDEVLRDGFGPEFELIVGKMAELNAYAKDNKEELTEMLQGGFENLNKIVTMLPEVAFGIGLVTAAQIRWNIAAAANPYIAAATAVVLLNESFKELNKTILGPGTLLGGAAGIDLSLGGTVDKFVEANDATNKLFDSLKGITREIKGIPDVLASSHLSTILPFGRGKGKISVPKDVVGKGGGVDEKALRAAERLKKKMMELFKSTNSIRLANLKNAATIELVINENKYKALLVSDEAYLKEKQRISLNAAKKEVEINKSNLEQAQVALAVNPPEQLLKEAELTIKVNNAVKDLAKSKSNLAVVQLQNAGEYNELLKSQKELQLDIAKSFVSSKLDMIAVEERLSEISSGEAAKQRLDILSDGLVLEQEALNLNMQITDAEKKRYNQQLKGIQATSIAIREQNKLLQDQTAIGGMNEAIKEYQESLLSVGERVQEAFTSMFQTIEDETFSFLQNGKFSFESLLSSFEQMADRMVAKWLITQATISLFGDQSGGSDLGGLVGKGIGLASSFFSPVQGPENALPAGFHAPMSLPARAKGGPVTAGRTYLVNENRKTEGPETFTPGVSGVITPASKMSGKGVTKNYVSVVVPPDRVNQFNQSANQIGNKIASKLQISQRRNG